MKKELTKLPKKFKEKWVKALRSGKYVQVTGRLYKGNNSEGKPQMCCLGVAEVVCGTDLEKLRNIGTPWSLGKEANSPEILREEYNPNALNLNLITKLAVFNDTDGKSFKWIASYIERYL